MNIPIEKYIKDNYKDEISDYLRNNIKLYDTSSLFSTEDALNLKNTVCNLPFIYNHVGGHGTNSPRRGVCVVGNSCLDGTYEIPTTYWSSSMNSSHVVLETETVRMPEEIKRITGVLQEETRKNFVESKITKSTYCLGVVNQYDAGSDHTIAGHTDAQLWYASPQPTFVSITYYPDGEPKKAEYCHRFYVRDEYNGKWRFLHLPDNSVCIMDSRIEHRVLPPLKKYRSESRRRINITLRNLCSPITNPIGYYQAISNHMRYYGKPLNLIIPKDTEIKDHKELFMKYVNLACQVGTDSKFSIIRREATGEELRKEHQILKKEVIKLYKENGLDLENDEQLLNKPNIMIQTTLAVLNLQSLWNYTE